MALPLTQKTERRVALVDDSPAVRQSLSMLLKNRGYAVDSFSGAGELLSALEEGAFDIFVLDLKLQESNGIALLSAIRSRGIAAPAILITGWEAGIADKQARDAGFEGFVRKPMLETSIVDEVRRLVGPPGPVS
ncbi:response regulator [Hyphomonas sp.]|uniref:response regulator n=1 Tax=Hyphomonas sp. TaxID=87 RepID=UPI00391D488E